MNDKLFKVGDKVLICGILETFITKVDYDNDVYYFLDGLGNEYTESSAAIELLKHSNQLEIQF